MAGEFGDPDEGESRLTGTRPVGPECGSGRQEPAVELREGGQGQEVALSGMKPSEEGVEERLANGGASDSHTSTGPPSGPRAAGHHGGNPGGANGRIFPLIDAKGDAARQDRAGEGGMEEGQGRQGEVARQEEAKLRALQGEMARCQVEQSLDGMRGEEAGGGEQRVTAEGKERRRKEERAGELTGDDFELHDEGMVGGGVGLDQGWEAFLPRGSLRVLLVEDDDSTRHVVAALLRNCGYEGTAASPYQLPASTYQLPAALLTMHGSIVLVTVLHCL